jgi:hypothetical protein
MNQKTIISILAVIGALVVAGWLLRLAFHLFVPLAVVGVCVVVYMAMQDKKRIK